MTGCGQEPKRTFALAIDGGAFQKAAKLFSSWIPRNQLTSRVGLWLDHDSLVIRVGNDEARVAATGAWPGTVITQAGFIALSAGLPASEATQLTVDGDLLRVKTRTGSRSSACEVLNGNPEWPHFIEQLTPFTLLECLLLPQRFSAASIAHSGFADEVARGITSVRDLVECLGDATKEVATEAEIDPAEAQEVLEYLVGPGLEELQRRKQ